MSGPRRWAGIAILFLTLVGAALAVGAVHPTVLCFVAIGAVAAAWVTLGHDFGGAPRMAASVLLFVGVGLTLFTAAQALPLPAWLIARLAPQNADVWARALLPLREAGPAWHPLSVDPIATRIEVLRGITYIAAFLTSWRIARGRAGVQLLVGAVVLCAFILTLVSLLHAAFGARRLFGLYTPEHAIVIRHLSPLLNPNTLAAYLNIGVCLTLAAGLAPRPSVPRPVVFAIALVLVAMQLWVASRGGLAAMAVGIVLVVAMLRTATSMSARRRPPSRVVLPLLAIAAVGMLVLSASQDAFQELASSDVSKLTIHRQMLPFVGKYVWLGAGRGAFESAFAAHRVALGNVTFAQPEQVFIQWGGEWGVPVSLAAVLAIGWALRPKTALARTPLVVGPWAAIMAGAAHNLVDLNSEVPGVMLGYVTCAAIVVAGTGGGSRGRIGSWAARPGVLRWALVGAAGAALVAVVPVLGRDLVSDRSTARALVEPMKADDDVAFAGLRGAMLRHPAEPYLPLMGALRASRTAAREVMPWVGRTVELAPVYPPAHLFLARWLWARSSAQARLEYRLTIEQAPELRGHVLHEATGLVVDYDSALSLVPQGRGWEESMYAVSLAVGARLPATQALLDDSILARDALNRDSLVRRTRSATRSLGEPWCEGDARACLEESLRLSKTLIDRAPTACEGHAYRAEALANSGEAQKALDELEGVFDRVDDRPRCIAVALRVASTAKLEARAASLVEKLARTPCFDEAVCLPLLSTAGDEELSVGRPFRALTLYRKAQERFPGNERAWERVARAAELAGFYAEALDAYSRLAKRYPGESRWSEGASRQRAALERIRSDAPAARAPGSGIRLHGSARP